MNWISDFVDLSGLDKMDLIKRFSLSTAEVENEIFEKGKDLSGVVVAKILEVNEHPESKKLHLLKVDAGKGPVDVVCGAPNVRVGMKTAFAQVGAHIGDIDIAPRALAGYTSNGMCCSEKEIGISDDHSGIMDITDDVALGTDIKDLYAIDDIIFEVDNKSLTNRPDLWGHYGIAREFAAIAGRPLKPLDQADLTAYNNLPAVDLKIENKLCYKYSCIKFENINTNVSPVNMRIRLYYCGMRAINLLADLTNYLMLEMGQPMHAFDSRKVEKIRVKTFDKPFKFTTLDGEERTCDENTLMICNDNTPVAIAGIMGGIDSEIVEDTTTLTLESACFDAASVRKSTVRLGHRTDASQRYEKSLDPKMTEPAVGRFLYLLKNIDGGVQVVSRLTTETAFEYPERTIKFDKAFVDKYTGIDISSDAIEKTLISLGFGVSRSGDNFDVKVPSYRATKDVTMKADIIEEITRIYGYDNFDIHTAKAPLYPVRPLQVKTTEDKVKDILVKSFGLHELHSYIWQYYDEYRELGIEVEENVKLSNSSSPLIETLRNSIVPTQLVQVKSNFQYDASFGVFEVGRVVRGLNKDKLCDEHKVLCVTLFDKTKSVEDLYYDLSDILDSLVLDIKHKEIEYKAAKTVHNYVHPKNCNEIVVDGVTLGFIGIAHPTVSKKIDKKASIVFAEIDIELLSEIKDKGIAYDEPGKFPEMTADLSFTTGSFAPVKEAVAKINSALVKGLSVIDRYRDGNTESLTVRLTFGNKERTLTREEVTAVTDDIIRELESHDIKLKL